MGKTELCNWSSDISLIRCAMFEKKLVSRIAARICIGFALLISASCQHRTSQPQAANDFPVSDSLMATIPLDTVTMKPFIDAVTLNGKVSADENKVIHIYPMISGKVLDVKASLGDYVHRGQELATIMSGDIASYQADLIQATSDVNVAKKNLDATKDLYEGGLASAKDYATAQAQYESALANLKRVQQLLQINGGGHQSLSVIRSPIDGFIINRQINPDMMIRPDNSNELFTISDLKNVWVIANVYESNIPDVHEKDSVQITTLAYPDKVFRGQISQVMHVLDPVNKVMQVRIVLPNPGYLLKPEMFASVTVVHPDKQLMMCIPDKDLIFDHSRYYVLVYHGMHHVEIRPVEVEKEINGVAFISSGLKPGELILGDQQLLIYQALNQ
ncbi:cobalt-zinc-cadmium efflux system membrane fusion protein [Thermoflavifilum aggregans]|uniref:Cobalt-zinc-cadmium efflux system membrane fusion protein n=2 Tax=Thermoflavifilum aggregans TaxID=454188 RepID=A0A2M9CVF7_9BACT|nr:cobalt-zinc-cadmium efflux system membrane fusion protein [Thermoflavifilum aggregans]